MKEPKYKINILPPIYQEPQSYVGYKNGFAYALVAELLELMQIPDLLELGQKLNLNNRFRVSTTGIKHAVKWLLSVMHIYDKRYETVLVNVTSESVSMLLYSEDVVVGIADITFQKKQCEIAIKYAGKTYNYVDQNYPKCHAKLISNVWYRFWKIAKPELFSNLN